MRGIERLLQPRRNCWKTRRAERFGVLIDACAYYRALYETLLLAEEQVIILGWDTDSRVKLCQDDPSCPAFGEFLSQLLKQKPKLRIHILSWDYAFIYAFEREALPKIKFELMGEPRLEFILDNNHPVGASQHQKIVVVDDQIAFSGGLDITGRRWDTPEHRGVDQRRIDPGGSFYAPFHDVQCVVAGEAAQALGDLARNRWSFATGVELAKPNVKKHRLPSSIPILLDNVEVGISRTYPLYGSHRPVYEVEKLFHDMIADAKKFIYIENQYFTSDEIAKSLAKRLQEPNGPEVVMVLPCDNSGWLEENTMGILRARALNRLKEADRFARLRVLHPVTPGLPKDKYLQVHSKVMIVDDRVMRIGSANLSQRSMGFDSECDITIEARSSEINFDQVKKAIQTLRGTLLSEHLGVTLEQFSQNLSETNSLIKTVDELRGRERSLVDLDWQIPEWVDHLLPETELIDPPRPYRPWKILRKWWSGRSVVRASLPLKICFFWLLITGLFLSINSFAQGDAEATTPKTPSTAVPPEQPPKPVTINPDDYKGLCGKVFIGKDEKLELKTMETRLLCGDNKQDQVGKPWSDIPANEASFFLSSFLQSRGYHKPQMEIIGENLYVHLGPKARAGAFTLKNEPIGWQIPNRRYVRGRILDPSLLNELEHWSEHQLKVNGYACGEAHAMADPNTGEIEVTLQPKSRLRIKGTEDENATGLYGGVMERYNAFLTGDFYNQRLVDLTQKRISEEGIVSTIDLKPRCEEDGVTVTRRIDPGPSRQVRIGIGGSTDEGPRIRLNARQTRLGSSASTAQANIDVSFKKQVASASVRWYYSRTLTSFFLEPVLEFRNLNQGRREQTFDATLYHGWFFNFRPTSLTFRVGPNYSENFLIEGVGPRRSTLTVLTTDATWMTHGWEFFRHSPREGFNQALDLVFAQDGIGSRFTAQKVRYQGEQLFNIANFDPPMAIFGFRWSLGSTFGKQDIQTSLPTRFQFFGGGVGGLRGWEAEQLPRAGSAFSQTQVGSELRFYKLLFNLVDPLIFFDVGRLGDLNFKLEDPTFFSPGAGLRWESPVGVLRAFLSRPIIWGLPAGEPEYKKSLHLGLTLGEEF